MLIMKIFTKRSTKNDRNASKASRVKAKMAGCFDFRQKTMSFDFPTTVVSSGGFSMFGKMLRSRSDSDVSPSKKKHSEVSPNLSPKSSPSVNAPKRRFVRVVRGSNQSDQYPNPYVKRKTSDPKIIKKLDLEALNRRYFSDSDSDSDTQIKKDRDFQRSKSEERSPSVPINIGLKKNLSLDVDMGKRAHFRDNVDIIGIDKEGEKVYTAKGKIQFDNFETCDIKPLCDSCPIVEPEGLDPISETPELAKSPPRLMTLEQGQSEGVLKNESTVGVKVEKEAVKEPSPIPEEVNGDFPEETHGEHLSLSDSESDQTAESTESGIRPRTSSLDHYQRPFRFIGRLFRSTSDSIMKIGSPKGSPDQMRRRHRYVRVLRDSDHGDEYHNPYVIRRSTSQEQSSISSSVDNIHEINERLRPILRKQNSLDLSTTASGKHTEVHAHFQETVEVVEFTKKTRCVNLIDEKHMPKESHLKSDEENESFDSACSDEVFHEKRLSDLTNMDPGVISDDSSDDVSKLERAIIDSKL